MAPSILSLDELARQLGRDRREVEKLANRGRIPGRKVSGVWHFHENEIAQWLEQEMRDYTLGQLQAVEESQQSLELDAEIPVTSLLTPDTIEIPLNARTKRSVLESLIDVAGRTWHVWEPATVLKAVQEREALCSTAFGQGVAIPHPRQQVPEALGESVVAFGRTYSGIPFGGPRSELTDLFFLVLCRDARTHLQVLARLGRMIRQDDFLDSLRTATTPNDAYRIIADAEQGV